MSQINRFEDEENYSSPKTYFHTFDVIRIFCMVFICAITFSLPIPYFSLISVFLNFASGTLFAIYGFLVLRDENNLTKNIIRTLIAFLIMLVIYLSFSMGYAWYLYGSPFVIFTKRTIFNFVVLNYWFDSIGSSIWYIQSALYALIFFKIFHALQKFKFFRVLKKFDWLFCILLFIGSILIGELSVVIKFSFLGYNYIPGNFLTRTIPYMLVGRLVYYHYKDIPEFFQDHPYLVVLIGLVLSVGEFLALGFTGCLGYTNHMAGFILMAAGLCMVGIKDPDSEAFWWIRDYAPTIYKGMYYVYCPFGYALLMCAPLISQSETFLTYCGMFIGVAVILLTLGGFYGYAFLKRKLKYYDRINSEYEEE